MIVKNYGCNGAIYGIELAGVNILPELQRLAEAGTMNPAFFVPDRGGSFSCGVLAQQVFQHLTAGGTEIERRSNLGGPEGVRQHWQSNLDHSRSVEVDDTLVASRLAEIKAA